MKGIYYSRVIKAMTFVVDFWLIYLAFMITKALGLQEFSSRDQSTSFLLIFGLIWIVAGFSNKIYRLDKTSLLRTISINLFTTLLFHFTLLCAILLLTNIYRVHPALLVCLYALTSAFVIGFRLFYKLVSKYFQFYGFDQRSVIVIGAGGSGSALCQYFTVNESAGYHFAGSFVDGPVSGHAANLKVLGTLDPQLIKTFCLKNRIGEIYFALPHTFLDLLQDISKFADDNFIYFRVAPDFSELSHDNGNVFLINSIPILTTRKEPLGISLNANLKRVFDIVFSLLVITLLFPVLIPVMAVAIRLDSPGPIFFKQLRPGKKNKLFDCYKFRTMRINQTTELQATKNDPRITRIGAFMRKTNIDELPQFFNVLLGNMSVVGPRPNMISQLEEYSKSIDNYKVRHFVTPGITGYAQVNGFRGETREIELMQKRVQYDVEYIENWSLALDLKIVFLTVWNMFKGEKNAY